MAKRKVEVDDSDIELSSTDGSDVETSPQEQEGEEMVDVDFDYFDLDPNVDFHATKTFLRQLFGDDATKFDISGLADLILTENLVGTTIKTDGKESDPFALLSVINATTHGDKPAVSVLVDYILEKTKPNAEFNMILRKLLKPGKSTKDQSKQFKVGLIISERMINMPVEVVPPMYRMLLEEIEKAEDAHEKYDFDYFLVVSKIFKLVNATIQDDDDEQKSKKKKADKFQEEFDYFHYEDIILEENAKYSGRYEYTEKLQETDSRRVFTEYGIDPRLSVMLLDKAGMQKSVPEMAEKFPPF